ncbi:MAG: DUF4062 domain-containing protein, partial [Longimicrobiales bacterium]
MAKTPAVFISSTSEDLESYRNAARDALLQARRTPLMMEYFTAQGKRPPYAACMKKVREADVVFVIVAHRYGWVPDDQPPPGGKSITWLECDEAVKCGKEVVPFLVSEKHAWPLELREAYRLNKAIEEDHYTPELAEEVNRNRRQLDKFKEWLGNLGFRAEFASEGDLKAAVLAAIYGEDATEQNPAKYLEWLREQTGWIDIRGLSVGSGKANRFPIGDLYIPLTTMEGAAESARELREPVPLQRALKHKKLVIVGDPGGGKTTFLRRIAFELCGGSGMKLPFEGFPIPIRVAEIEEHIANCSRRQEARSPTTGEVAAWLPHFLARRSDELKWELDEGFFEQKLADPSTVVLLDGLDEAPNAQRRESIARLFESATGVYRKCRFVVTTRPGA